MEYKRVLHRDDQTGEWIVYSIRRTPNGSVYSVRLGPVAEDLKSVKSDIES